MHRILNKPIDLTKVNWQQVIGAHPYLRKLPVRYLVQRYISDEALRLVDDISGYNSLLTVWNAADGLPWNLAEFGRPVWFRHVVEGFDVLPHKMRAAFESVGDRVNTEHTLKSLGVAGQRIELRFSRPAGLVVRANKVILAMPKRSLQLLDDMGDVLADKTVQKLIDSVTPIPLFKLAICYPFAWWETIEPVPVLRGGIPVPKTITSGQSVTDLPVRQCYYWAKDRRGEKAVVLVYDDGRDREYWEGLLTVRSAADWFGKMHKIPIERGERQWNGHPATKHLVEEAHRQLLEMHKVRHRLDIPEPYAAACCDWGADPYGGGVNFWRVGVDSGKVAEAILQPLPKVPVFICGEAYSHDQGWVEGALKTADCVLDKLGLPMPP